MAKSTGVPAPGEYFTPEGDLRTLMQAHKIKSDKKRHAAALAYGKKQYLAMKSVMMSGPEDNPKEKA